MPDTTPLKDVSEKVDALVSALERVANLSDDDKARLGLIASKPVGLRDTADFNLAIDIVKRSDLQAARRDLASAIAAEKWTEGFAMGLQIMKMFGGLAP